MANHLRISPYYHRLPCIKKVLRQGRRHVCGLCRTRYKFEEHAIACLDNCWHQILQMDPVIPVRGRDRNQFLFKCRYCCRKYLEVAPAQACAIECRDAYHLQHLKEMEVYNLPLEELERRKGLIQQMNLTSIPTTVVSRFQFGKKSDTEPQEVEETQAMSEEDHAVEAEVEDIITPPPAEEKPRRHKSEFPKQWVRKDAKYECTFCHSQFFTKIEVEKCFAEHFDGEDLEILND